jgi:tetratricopeptide (TPR) repeat protein
MADWPAPPPATYVAAKRALLTRKPAACSFDYAGGGFFGGTAAQAWRDMVSERRARYFVTVDPRVYPVPARVYNRALDAQNFPLLLHKIEESGLFEAEPALQQDRGIRIFRRLDRPDLITLGRALSDERRHDQAIERLREASRSEPDDAEAWANLQLAYERRGRLDDAIAAGKRGLQLEPDHYYLNHGLARAYAAQGRWTKAIRHGERAAAAAPTTEARVEVLALCGRAWLAKGDVDKGCRLLREAGQLPADGTSHPCLSGR